MSVRQVLVIVALVAVVLVGWGVRRAIGTAKSAVALRGTDGAAGDEAADPEGVRSRDNDSAARRVRAQIVDDDGEPLEGGHVSLRCLYDDEVTAIGNTWKLDEVGGFEGPGCLGLVCVELHHASAVPTEPWVLAPGEPAVLRATGLPRLHGTVVDARARPIAAARITVRAVGDGDPEAIMPTIGTTTTTDVDGAYSFALVQRAPCDPCTEADRGCDPSPLPLHDRVVLGVNATGFAPARVEVEVDGSDATVPDVRLAPPADVLSGTLLDPGGDAYPRATVIARAANDPSEQHQTELTGEGFAFESLGAGPYDLRALQDGVELAIATGRRPGEDVELVGSAVARGPDIEVEITRDGEPVANVEVDGGPFRGARTDLHGHVRADVAMPGPYMLSLRPPGAGLVRRALTIPSAPERSLATHAGHAESMGQMAAVPAAPASGPGRSRLQLRIEL